MNESILTSKISKLESNIENIDKKLKKEEESESKLYKELAKVQKKLSNAKTSALFKSCKRKENSITSSLEKTKYNKTDLLKRKSDELKTLSKQRVKLSNLRREGRKKVEQKASQLYSQSTTLKIEEIEDDIKHINKEKFESKNHDVFISHSSSDKESFVNDLIASLRNRGIDAWYDEDNINWGNSIRQSIDKGIRNSRFCIIVISKEFLNSYWTNYELDSIFQKDSTVVDSSIILPIWHNINKDEIQKHSYKLSDIQALSSEVDTEEITEALENLLGNKAFID